MHSVQAIHAHVQGVLCFRFATHNYLCLSGPVMPREVEETATDTPAHDWLGLKLCREELCVFSVETALPEDAFASAVKERVASACNRRSQNWIDGSRPGNTADVPFPPEYVNDCLEELESFLYREEESLPLLLRAGLAHAQFETIHPFFDGNGRVGRLLIMFVLAEKRMLH